MERSTQNLSRINYSQSTKGEISTNEDFYEYLVELGVQERAGDLEAYIKDLEQKSDENQQKLEESERKKRRVT